MTNRVFVLGAGFTRAFYKNAPLIVDDYHGPDLLRDFDRFPAARLVLETEMSRTGGNRLDLERVMTRLDSGMPYDRETEHKPELQLLLSRIKGVFLHRIEEAKAKPEHERALRRLAAYCIRETINCITFNYDDTFDKSLFNAELLGGSDPRLRDVPNAMNSWGPQTGYGFPCRGADQRATPIVAGDRGSAMALIKLHGSMNWFPLLGAQRPHAVSDIFHKEEWFVPRPDYLYNPVTGTLLIETSPLIVPPVLVKSALVNEPILRLLWSSAHNLLTKAEHVCFVGYSMPATDIASGFLFREALQKLDPANIQVVNYAAAEDDPVRSSVKTAFRALFPGIPDKNFDFRGALAWASDLTDSSAINA